MLLAAGLPSKLEVQKLQVHELPLPRPRLAALGPVQNLGIKAEEEARTAIYDITAQTVYLPSGERLEAHSGLGSLMDDPRYVHEKNRGATPPNTYALKLRKSLFHGVQAVRLTPVGDGNMFNRDGILAHSYMLGPNGQSNGCVSFKDYPKFLRAYLRGEIDRIVVVSRLTRPPAFAARPGVRSAQRALAASGRYCGGAICPPGGGSGCAITSGGALRPSTSRAAGSAASAIAAWPSALGWKAPP